MPLEFSTGILTKTFLPQDLIFKACLKIFLYSSAKTSNDMGLFLHTFKISFEYNS